MNGFSLARHDAAALEKAGNVVVLRSTLDFAVRQSWLLLPSVGAGAGAGYAAAGFSPVMAGGAALGLAPALAAGLALELRGYKLRTAEDVERRVDLETLGAIGRFKQSPGSALPADDYPEALQAYKELAASLRTRGGHELRTLLVTSAGPEEGKSTTAANLATILAELGHKVVLVDGDLRWSSLRSTSTGTSSLGLSGLLLNYLHTPQLAVVRTNERNLFLLPAGILPPNPQALLALPRLGDIIASLRTMADYVIFDSPPVLEADDARLLARSVDATLLVMHAGKTRSREVNKALRILLDADVRPLGAVLNGIHAPARAAAPKRAPEPAVAPVTTPEPEPYTVEAFRKGTPRPMSANVPRPSTPDLESPVLKLAQDGLDGKQQPAPAPVSGFESPEYARRLAALRNLRVVQPDERPLAPAVNDWDPVIRPRALKPVPEAGKPSLSEVPEHLLASSQLPAPVADAPEVEAPHLEAPRAPEVPVAPQTPVKLQSSPEPDVSVDAVLAHMEETLQLIREMRQEKSISKP